MAAMEAARVASGVGMLAAGGFNLTVLATHLSAPAAPTPEPELSVTVPAGVSPGDQLPVTFGSGARGVVTVPPALTEGETFRVRPRQQAAPSQQLRCALANPSTPGSPSRS